MAIVNYSHGIRRVIPKAHNHAAADWLPDFSVFMTQVATCWEDRKEHLFGTIYIT
jgi:hypothetical protein